MCKRIASYIQTVERYIISFLEYSWSRRMKTINLTDEELGILQDDILSLIEDEEAN